MADATEADTDIQYLNHLVPALIVLIAGLVIHSFIIGVNVTDWWKGRSVTPVDHIVSSLGISRMCAQCVNTLYLFVDILFPRNFFSYVIGHIAELIYDFFICANLWLTSLLSIVFFLKISNFHSRLFLYLRGVIAHRTVYCIVTAVLLSAINSLVTFLINFIKETDGTTHNTTMAYLSYDCTLINSVYIYTIGASIPLLFCCISSVLLFTSLYHHTVKMKKSSNVSINLEAYYSVMRFICFTFIYNIIYFIGHFVFTFLFFFYCVNLDWLYIILDFPPVLHSSYLIYRTPKLRSQMSKVLQNLMDFLLQRKHTETGENIAIVAQ